MSCVHTTDTIIAIILAGGKSSRMGQNKALLPYKNQRMIDHMAKILQDANLSSIYVSGQIEGYSCIPDVIKDVGPAGGIYSVLNYFGPTQHRYLFIPVDMPLLQPHLITRLIQQSDHQQAVYFKDHYLPMLLPDSTSLRNYLHNELVTVDAANYSMKKILHAVNAKSIELHETELLYFSNINTPLELELLTNN